MLSLNMHVAIYFSNTENKNQLIRQIQSGEVLSIFKDLQGALFSEIAINKFIEEEQRHWHYHVQTATKNSLEKSSSGERKKALLQHIVSKDPDYIIVDNVFGNLDVQAQANIEKTLQELSKQTTIIQITNRKSDVLKFITQLYKLEGRKLIEVNDLECFIDVVKKFVAALPKPYCDTNTVENPIVKLNEVTVSYGDRTIVKNINWEINTGEFWQLIGPNGSGKSTLLTMIYGDNPKAFLQNIKLFGNQKGQGESVWEIKKKIGYFSSEMLRGFMRSDSIERMILSGFFDSIGLYKIPTDRQIIIAHQWLHLLGMYDIKDSNFLNLSTGHQRLVLVARALVKHPPLLILDEPTNGLDDQDVMLFIALINKVASESDTSILYVSHRNESGLLRPDFIYKLSPNKSGSTGKVIMPNP